MTITITQDGIEIPYTGSITSVGGVGLDESISFTPTAIDLNSNGELYLKLESSIKAIRPYKKIQFGIGEGLISSANNNIRVYLYPGVGVLSSSNKNILQWTSTEISSFVPHVYSFDSVPASNFGITIPDRVQSFQIVHGTETTPFQLSPPKGIAGQILYVRNDSHMDTIGLVVPADSGRTFLYNGAKFVQV